jgi:hypothetical protein
VLFGRYINSLSFKPTRIAGVEIFYNNDDTVVIAYVIIFRKNKKIGIEGQSYTANSLDELFAALPKDIPVCISVSGKGILNKKLSSNTDAANTASILHQIIPNATIENFYIQANECEGSTLFSIARKDNIHDLINSFNNQKHQVVDLTFGPFVANMLPLLDVKVPVLKSSNFSIEYRSDRVFEITKIEKDSELLADINIQGEIIQGSAIIPYLAATKYLAGFNSSLDRFSDILIVLNSKVEVFYQQIFKKLAVVISVFFLVALLINFVFFSSISNKNEQLSYKYALNKQMLNRLDTLTSELTRKEKFLSDNNIKTNVLLSYYADRIAYILPKQITLTKLNVQPAQNDVEKEEVLVIKKNTIYISGTLDNAITLNNSLAKLKKESWVKKIDINNYKYDDKMRFGEFDIVLYCVDN